jgi:hypothetical protein
VEQSIDDLYEKYRETLDLFFDGDAREHFAVDARGYAAILESQPEDEDEHAGEEDDAAAVNETRRSVMPRTLFPVSEYYAEHVVDGTTLSRNGSWWSALLLIRDPRTQVPFLNMYRWEQVDGTWKNRKSYVIRDQQAVDKIIAALNEFRARLPAT